MTASKSKAADRSLSIRTCMGVQPIRRYRLPLASLGLIWLCGCATATQRGSAGALKTAERPPTPPARANDLSSGIAQDTTLVTPAYAPAAPGAAGVPAQRGQTSPSRIVSLFVRAKKGRGIQLSMLATIKADLTEKGQALLNERVMPMVFSISTLSERAVDFHPEQFQFGRYSFWSRKSRAGS